MILDFSTLKNSARAWIYQSDRVFTDDEVQNIRISLGRFLESWTSHNRDLVTFGDIFHNRFLAIFVDEGYASASGCSIDASVSFVRNLESEYNVNMFDRMNFTYMDGETVRTLPSSSLAEAYKSGEINDETLFFDNLVKTKEAFLNQWLVPLEKSWHKRFV